jgi:hypothetical protein
MATKTVPGAKTVRGTKTAKESNPRATGSKGKKQETQEEKQQAKVIEELLEVVEKKLKDKSTRVSLGDYLRLVQLRKELEGGDVREIKVGWVDRLEGDGDPSRS